MRGTMPGNAVQGLFYLAFGALLHANRAAVAMPPPENDEVIDKHKKKVRTDGTCLVSFESLAMVYGGLYSAYMPRLSHGVF